MSRERGLIFISNSRTFDGDVGRLSTVVKTNRRVPELVTRQDPGPAPGSYPNGRFPAKAKAHLMGAKWNMVRYHEHRNLNLLERY